MHSITFTTFENPEVPTDVSNTVGRSDCVDIAEDVQVLANRETFNLANSTSYEVIESSIDQQTFWEDVDIDNDRVADLSNKKN